MVELDNTSGVLQRDIASPVSTPSRHVAKREALVILANALEQLPEPQREAVALHHLRGMSLADLARRLGRTEASVAGLLRRGVKRLRDLLRESE